ncbi:MAG: hypothetical protein RR343_04775 [Oscillospiraceae bacterium]
MKDKIFVASSVVLFIFFALINMFSAFNHSIGAINFILSFIFVVFWCVMIAMTVDNKSVMIYCITAWGITFVASLIALIAAATQANVGFLMVPATFLVAPMTGLAALVKVPVANFSIMLVVSFAFTGWSTFSLAKKARY